MTACLTAVVCGRRTELEHRVYEELERGHTHVAKAAGTNHGAAPSNVVARVAVAVPRRLRPREPLPHAFGQRRPGTARIVGIGVERISRDEPGVRRAWYEIARLESRRVVAAENAADAPNQPRVTAGDGDRPVALHHDVPGQTYTVGGKFFP